MPEPRFKEVNTPEQALSVAVEKMSVVAKHPLVPNFVGKRMFALLRRTSLVNDEQFRVLTLRALDPSTPRTIVDESQTGQGHMNAAYIESEDRVIIRESQLARDHIARLFLPDLLAEEIGHGMALRKIIPFNQVADRSLMLMPFGTKPKLLDQLNSQRPEYFGLQSKLNPAALQVLIRGFSAVFLDKHDNLAYLTSRYQINLEETRAAIMQTVLEIIERGITKIPGSRHPVEQFNVGNQQLEYDIRNMGPVFSREYGGVLFLDEMLRKTPHLDKFIKDLFFKLMNNNVDQYYSSLSAQERQKFGQAMLYTAAEYRGRAED